MRKDIKLPELLTKKILVIAVILLSTGYLHTQENQSEPPFFFAAPAVEAVMYGRTPPSIGYGFALGSEGRISLGFKGMYAMPLEEHDITTFEITLFFRVYVSKAANGLFAQFTYGAVMFLGESEITFPAEKGSFSIGITAGWRFPLGSRFFIEPYIRGGYPYLGGAGISTGVRF